MAWMDDATQKSIEDSFASSLQFLKEQTAVEENRSDGCLASLLLKRKSYQYQKTCLSLPYKTSCKEYIISILHRSIIVA